MTEILSRAIENTSFSEYTIRGLHMCGNCKFYGANYQCKKYRQKMAPMSSCRSWRKRHD